MEFYENRTKSVLKNYVFSWMIFENYDNCTYVNSILIVIKIIYTL